MGAKDTQDSGAKEPQTPAASVVLNWRPWEGHSATVCVCSAIVVALSPSRCSGVDSARCGGGVRRLAVERSERGRGRFFKKNKFENVLFWKY